MSIDVNNIADGYDISKQLLEAYQTADDKEKFLDELDSLKGSGAISNYNRDTFRAYANKGITPNGNISVNTLSKLTTPLSWSSIASDEKAAYHDVTNYTVSNIRAATNGANKEGINAAYNNFKKTIGTFDTLVTCRDYMNKIYNLVSAADNTTPLVSNVIVSDIKDDINRAVTIGTFTSRGIEYKVIAKPGKQLTHFDLIMYPFKSTYGLNSKSEFNKSFKYDNSNYSEILANIEDTKTISHNFLTPNFDELACVKNYYIIIM